MSNATLKVKLYVRQHDMSVEEAQAMVIDQLQAQVIDQDLKLAKCLDHLDALQIYEIFGNEPW